MVKETNKIKTKINKLNKLNKTAPSSFQTGGGLVVGGFAGAKQKPRRREQRRHRHV